MAGHFKSFLTCCANLDFGPVILAGDKGKFCSDLNHEIISLCKSLPLPAQTGVLFFLMRYFRIPFDGKFTIFKRYYAPAWSIIYWLLRFPQGRARPHPRVVKMSMTAHSMALLLHPLDDHLNDGQEPVSHLALLLRSQAWMIMHTAFSGLLDIFGDGHDIVDEQLGHYYASIDRTANPNSLNVYCERFRNQMATWQIVPLLLVKNIQVDARVGAAIQSAYESFGIAWRLLDDVNDIQTDMMRGAKSAIYACLPEEIRVHWDRGSEEKNSDDRRIILDYLLQYRVIDTIRERIGRELELAASAADDCRMTGWGDEFRCLLKPLNI